MLKGRDVTEVVFKNLPDLFLVDFPIKVNKPVPESRHFDIPRNKIWIHDLRVCEDAKDIGVLFWKSEPSNRYNMISKIEQRFDRQLQIPFGSGFNNVIAQKFLFPVAPQRFKPMKIFLEPPKLIVYSISIERTRLHGLRSSDTLPCNGLQGMA
jgi:hypothetical protein